MKKLDYYLNLPYPLVIKPIPEDEGGGYYAKYIDFAAASAHGDGATIEEAIANARESLKFALEHILNQGHTPPEPGSDAAYSGKFNLRTPRSLHRRLAEKAQEEGVSLNQLAVSHLSEKLVQNSSQ